MWKEDLTAGAGLTGASTFRSIRIPREENFEHTYFSQLLRVTNDFLFYQVAAFCVHDKIIKNPLHVTNDL